jgi:hypothetical protein
MGDDIATLQKTVAALQGQIDALQNKVTRLEDIEAIKVLQRAYGYYLDKGLWQQITDLFAANGSIEIAGRGVYVGKDRIHLFLKEVIGEGEDGLVHGRLLNHLQTQGIVTVAPGGKTAKARWRAFIQAARLGGKSIWAEGPYEMDYVKIDGVWQIDKLLWFATYYTPFDQGWAKAGLPRNGVSDKYPPDRAPTYDYAAFPDVFVPPFHYKNPVTGR